MDKTRSIFHWIFAVFAAAFAGLVFALFFPSDAVAFATDPVVEGPTMTASFLSGINGTNAMYSEREYTLTDGYKKDVTATYVVRAPYYSFFYTVDGAAFPATRAFVTPNDGIVSFTAEQTGRYELVCVAYEDAYGEREAGRSEPVSFRNDVTAPIATTDAVEEMTVWRKTGAEYAFGVDWKVFSDAVSGLYEKIFYYFDYAEGRSDVSYVETATAQRDVLSVDRACDLVIVYYDIAGNGNVSRYPLRNFDDVAPPMPQYVVTPASEEGTYSSRYEIAVTFVPDEGGSGLSDVQTYRIRTIGTEYVENEQVLSSVRTVAFEATPPTPESILLTAQADYEITIYAVDKAGNRSGERVITVGFDAFDVTDPDMGDVTITYDLTEKLGVCRMGFNASDREESGIKRAYIEGKDVTFAKTAATGTYYSARFDPFGYPDHLTVVVEDNAGNTTKKTIPFGWFHDVEVNVAVQKATNAVQAVDAAEYAASAIAKIAAGADALEILLASPTATKAEIVNAANALYALATETVSVRYTIAEAPAVASSNVTFTASGFTGMKKGTEITVELTTGLDAQEDFVKKAGFSKGFTDTFGLKAYYGEERSEDLSGETIEVSMSMPNGYFDRKVALFDAKSGEVVETAIKNNRIVFTMTHSTEYVLAIEGGKATTTAREDKTIVVFGNRLKLSTFLWVVCGAGGLAVATIVAFIVIRKTRG